MQFSKHFPVGRCLQLSSILSFSRLYSIVLYVYEISLIISPSVDSYRYLKQEAANIHLI